MRWTRRRSYTRALALHGYEFRRIESLQDTKPKYSIDANLSIEVHLKLLDKKSGQTQDSDVNDDVCNTADDIHNWVIGRSYANYPVAPERPDLEECCEEE